MMLISQSQQALPRRALVAALLFAGALILTGCSRTVGDYMPAAIGGLPAATPERPATPAPYPAVNDTPPPRSSTALSYEEQQKLQDDLVAARKRTANPAGGARNP